MAIAVKVDWGDVLEATERNGGLRRFSRMAYVSGIDASDWTLLTKALDDAGVPQYGSYLTADTDDNAWDLMLVERNVKKLDKDKVAVTLVYENWVDLEENLDSPRGGYVTGSVRCNISQKTSNLDINGDQVTVAHTYPGDDPDYPGETQEQGGEFQYYDAERVVNIEGRKQTRTPWNIANAIIGRVNSVSWGGEAARYWLCTGVSWELRWTGRIGVTGGKDNVYLFNFEFQYNPDGWDPIVTFVDQRTGRPPADLVPGTGYKYVEKYREVNFDTVIGAPIQGG